MLSTVTVNLKKLLSNGYVLSILAGCFFIICGLLMEYNGVKEFSYADKRSNRQSGSPQMLYSFGGFIIALSLIRAYLFGKARRKMARHRRKRR